MAGSVGLQTFEVEQLLCQSWQGQRWGTCVLLLRTKCCRWHTPSLCTWSRREKSRFSVGLLNKQRHPGLILTKDEQQTARKHQAKQPLTTEQLGCNKSISEEQHQRGAASVRETTVRHRVEELAPNCQHPHHKKYLEIKGIMSDTVAPSLPLTPFTPPPTPPFFFLFFFYFSFLVTKRSCHLATAAAEATAPTLHLLQWCAPAESALLSPQMIVDSIYFSARSMIPSAAC